MSMKKRLRDNHEPEPQTNEPKQSTKNQQLTIARHSQFITTAAGRKVKAILFYEKNKHFAYFDA